MMKSYHPPKAQRRNLCSHTPVRIPFLLVLSLAWVAVWAGLHPVGTAHAQSLPQASAAAEQVSLEVEGQRIVTDVAPAIVDGRTLVPARVVAEALGATVGWDGAARAVTVVHRHTNAVLTIGAHSAVVNGQPVALDVPPQIIADRTMIPLRFIAEILGATVEWDAATRTVRIWKQPARVTGLTWVKGVGSARIQVALAEPLETYEIRKEKAGRRLVLTMRPTVVATDRPGYLLGDALVQALWLESTGRETRLVVDLTRPATYRVSKATDQPGLILELDYQVTGIDVSKDGQTPVIQIRTDGPARADATALESPDRIVIDLQGVTVGPQVAAQAEVKNLDLPWLRQARVEPLTTAPAAVRIVLDLSERRPFTVRQTDSGLELRFPPHLTGVRWEEFPHGTRVILDGTAPLDFDVQADPAAKRLDIRVRDAILAVDQRHYAPRGLAFSTLTLSPSGDPQPPVRAVLDLPYYLGHEVLSKPGDKQVIVELYSSPLVGKTIWIDAGHGGKEPGAVTVSGRYEKEINLAVALKLQQKLAATGARVLMTRTDDSHVDLNQRPQLANQARAEVFLSVHANSANSAAANGTETYYYTNHARSPRLAALVHQEMVAQPGLADRKVRTQNFVVLREAKMPAVLVELGYVSNPQEERLLLDPAWQERAAVALQNALILYFREQLTHSTS